MTTGKTLNCMMSVFLDLTILRARSTCIFLSDDLLFHFYQMLQLFDPPIHLIYGILKDGMIETWFLAV